MSFRSDRAALLVTTALLCLQAPAPAFAQNPVPTPEPAAAPEPAPPSGAQEIVVTGSRLATGFAMPTPVTTIGAEELMKTAPNSLAESLVQVPSLTGSVVSTNSGTGSANSQTNGQSLLDLRGLGPHRTLVLLDGQRMGVTNVVNSVDVNIIPQNLIRRVDVVTGGASASYGSDAVAGVVNFILDTRFEGFKAEISGGVTSRNDGENWHASIAFGKQFGDRTRIVGAADIYRLNGIPYGHTGRDWFDNAVGGWQNTSGIGPTTITAGPARSSVATYGGVIRTVTCPAGATGNACRTLGPATTATPGFLQFVDGGALVPFNRGTFAGSAFAAGGDGALVTNGLTPDLERESFFLHAEHDVTPDITFWAQGTKARSYSNNPAQTVLHSLSTPFTIFEGNPFLPAQVASIFAATPGAQSFTLSRFSTDMGLITVRGVSRMTRFAGGVKGKISSRWSFDVTGAYQDTLQELDVYNVIQNRRVFAAADVVVHPTTLQPVCRSNWFNAAGTFVPAGTGLDPGCVPMNLFGPNTVSPAAAAYVMGWNTADISLKQQTLDFNIRGDLGDSFQLGAGPISTAFGVSYRRLTANRAVDALSALNIDATGLRGVPTGLVGRYGSYGFYNPSPLTGKVRVSEAYGEIGVPILKDVPFFQALSTTLAGRVTDYSQSGIELMWKAGASWTVNDDIRFRGTYSADTRAPSVLELFNTAQVTNARQSGPWSGASPIISIGGQNLTLGNPNLSPEKARTFTAGVVLSPSFIPRLQMSVDYYKIKIKDSILTLDTQSVIDNCFFGDQTFCADIVANGRPVTTTVGLTTDDFVVFTSRAINFAQESTSGLDFEAAYSLPLGPGQLRARLTGNYLLTAVVESDCAGDTNLVGDIGDCGVFPRFKGRLGVNYDVGRLGIFVQQRFISAGKKNKNLVEGVDITENDVAATWYTDLNLTYRFGKIRGGDTEFFVNVTNVFDQSPRPTISRPTSWIREELGLYDALGRRYVAGLRVRF